MDFFDSVISPRNLVMKTLKILEFLEFLRFLRFLKGISNSWDCLGNIRNLEGTYQEPLKEPKEP